MKTFDAYDATGSVTAQRIPAQEIVQQNDEPDYWYLLKVTTRNGNVYRIHRSDWLAYIRNGK